MSTKPPGTERPRIPARDEEDQALRSLGLVSRYVMTVGSLEPRKNHAVLYKAFLRLLDAGMLHEPLQMVFVGKRGWKIDDFLSELAADTRVRGRILILSPSDEELELLYRRCSFTLLPSFYEGWSLTLPESLSHGKFCLTSDVAPLREIGKELVEYIHPLDTFRWAERIAFYANHPSELTGWEARIRAAWHPTSWREAAEALIGILHGAHRARFAPSPSPSPSPIPPA